MNINVISIFPEIIDASLHGLTGKAFKDEKANLALYDLKKFSKSQYGSVDDSPYGGGEGMVISAEPLSDCIKKIPLFQEYFLSFRKMRFSTLWSFF